MNAIWRVMLGGLLWMVPGDDWRANAVTKLALAGKTRAQAAFEHYRHGDGATRTMSTAALLHDDDGTRDALLRKLRTGESGVVCVGQRMSTNNDWRYALGSVRFDCHRVPGGVTVAAESRYGWHPDENRVTRPIHRLAARLQRHGAKPYRVVGDRVFVSDEQVARVSPRRELPVRTYLL